MAEFTHNDFVRIQRWFYDHTSINLKDNKKALVSARWQKRITQHGFSSLGEYFDFLNNDQSGVEEEIAINLLTTNETYFFREPKHFEFMERVIIPHLLTTATDRCVRIWSAAASTGQEAYTIALEFAQHYGIQRNWKILGTDVNSEVIRTAKRGVYTLEASKRIPLELLKMYGAKGVGKDIGWFRFKDELRSKVNFTCHNLMKPLPTNTDFDVIFLRNVLIYFDLDDKKAIVNNMVDKLRPGAWLLVGHSESISGYNDQLIQLKPGCYQKQD